MDIKEPNKQQEILHLSSKKAFKIKCQFGRLANYVIIIMCHQTTFKS